MAVERHQLSGRAIAKKAQDAGYSMTHTVFNQVLNGRYKSQITDEKIRAFAWLAGVTEATAFTAAGRPVPGPPLADELPDGVDNLSPRARKAVIEMLRVLVAAEQGSNHDGRTDEEVTEPRTQESYPPAMSRAGVSPAYDPDQHRLYGTKAEATEAVREIAQAEQPAVTAVPAAPRPNEYALAASDEPSEGRARRSIQDSEAEASQDDGDWDPA